MTTEHALLHDDEAARDAALDVTRSFIVQAPAGSGKTELLIQRYLKLLAIVTMPEEVLAITFTRKAAAEMQVRILQALQAAASEVEPSEEYERITSRAARAVLQRDQEYDWNLLANPKRMRIQTLDALNASIARTQPLTSTGGAGDTAIIADAEMRALYREAAALTLDQLAESGEFHEATRQVLVHVDTSVGRYIDYLARMLATRDQWLPFVGSGLVDVQESESLRRQLEENLEFVVARHLEKVLGHFPENIAGDLLELARYAGTNLLSDSQPDSPIALLSELQEMPPAVAGSVPIWSAIAEILLTKQGDWRKRANKNQGFPPGDEGQKERLGDLLEALEDAEEFRRDLHEVRALPPVCYSDEQWSVLLALLRLLPLAVTELKRLFAERRISDHIEVALSASNALGTADAPGDATLLLDYQIRHLLVDEMQDTSSAQYRMIEALTGGWESGDGRTLYCVGDPMQSIYRFRNAEVGQFLLAKETGIGSLRLTTLTLRRNFRSGENLVDWFNAMFPHILPQHDDPARSAVSYAPAISVPAFEGQGQCVVHPVLGGNTAQEADIGLDVIRRTMADCENDDMAVLVRGRTHLPELLYRLRQAGIAYRAVDIDRLTDLPEIIDVLALTRALSHQGDRHAWLALLRSPWVGLRWSDLHALVRNDRSVTVWEQLGDENALSSLSQEARAAIEKFRVSLAQVLPASRAETLRDRIERAWLALGGAAILEDAHAVENVYRFLDVIEGIEVAGNIADIAELENALDKEHVSSNVNARLQVMTMHRAKGLQFDHVLLFGLGRTPRAREQTVLSWFDIPDEHGSPRKVISPVGPRAELDKDAVHSYIGKVESEKDRHELGRLLYVACTRARKSLHLLGHARLLKSGMRPDSRSLLHLLWPMVAAEFESLYDPESHSIVAEQEDPWIMPVLRRFSTSWCMPATPALPADRGMPDESGDQTPVEFYWVGTGARFAGTLAHRWIQLATDGQVDLADLDEGSVRNSSTRWLREQGVSGAAGVAIVERVVSTLRSMSTDSRGQWLLNGEGHAELALSGIIDGRLESVILDRVRVDEGGTHWIVDYKTSSHEGGELQTFLEAETERYRPQLTRYTELYRRYSGAEIRCALYFPLLQEFVEVKL